MIRPTAAKKEKSDAEKTQTPSKVAGKVGRPLINHDAKTIDDSRVFAILAYACTIDEKFEKLYRHGQGNKGSQSELDEALCTKFAYYFNCTDDSKEQNHALIDYAFRRSALMRDKWNENRGGQTYAEMTISKAIEFEKQRQNDGKEPFEFGKVRLTIEILDSLLKEYKGENRQNLISLYPECKWEGKTTQIESIVATLHSKYGNIFGNLSQDTLYMYLAEIAYRNRYNPVLEYIEAEPADGKDYFPQLWKLLGIGIAGVEELDTEDEKLSKTLFRKWLYQSYWLLQNIENDEPLGLAGILILNGAQGTGKTSFFRALSLKSNWFGEGCSVNTADKDTKIQAISHWITELGEIECTLKSDIENLKNFITSPIDEIRMPYGRAQHRYPRHTSFCGTCNSERYLVDPTVNRRYWTVTLERTIPHKDLEEFPFLLLWRQVFQEAKEQGCNCFRLTAEEEKALNIRNGEFEKLLKGEQEVMDILTEAEAHADEYKTIEVSIAEWMTYHSTIFRGLSADQIAKAVRKQGVEGKHTRKGNVYNLPIHKGT